MQLEPLCKHRDKDQERKCLKTFQNTSQQGVITALRSKNSLSDMKIQYPEINSTLECYFYSQLHVDISEGKVGIAELNQGVDQQLDKQEEAQTIRTGSNDNPFSISICLPMNPHNL